MKFIIYGYLPYEAKLIREEVFCAEQGFINEFDETDTISSHLVAFENDVPIATCRIYPNENGYCIGRIAVIKAYRGKKIGAHIIEEAESYIRGQGGKEVSLSAQTRVEEFYRKQGYFSFGAVYLDEDCPHIKMIKKLN